MYIFYLSPNAANHQQERIIVRCNKSKSRALIGQLATTICPCFTGTDFTGLAQFRGQIQQISSPDGKIRGGVGGMGSGEPPYKRLMGICRWIISSLG